MLLPARTAGGCLSLLFVTATIVGCSHHHSPARLASTTQPAADTVGLEPARWVARVGAWCDPPSGWHPKPAEGDNRYNQQAWVSASGRTVYGVTRINLPFPVGQNIILWGFLAELRHREGHGELISKREDPDLPGSRVVADGGRYRVRINFIQEGWTAWAVYAGTKRDKPIVEDELKLAETAREHTRVGAVEDEAAAN